MVRFSKLPFRRLVREYGVDVAFTPMILAKEFKNSSFARDSDFTTVPEDKPLVIQFAATNPNDLAAAAELAAPWVDAVDINCGCPQRWAIQERIGAHLMTEPELVRDMVREVRARANIPCSIKIRSTGDDRKTIEFVQRAEKVGAEWITIHGRTRTQRPSNPADQDVMKLVKENVQVPVIANGDVFTKEDADRLVAYTGVDGVMSARGLQANPALFSGAPYTPKACVERYVQLALQSGTTSFIFHHHLMDMLEGTMAKADLRTFNGLSSIPAMLDFLEETYGYDFTER
ncbi:MAG: hypothetical protein DHS80DRAFT_27532 [Piptocephalis tieghemiana]|nr:MAG: hypothetical protein DHS80DRAFT_27532 [Piptocephalis tieghemiana]